MLPLSQPILLPKRTPFCTLSCCYSLGGVIAFFKEFVYFAGITAALYLGYEILLLAMAVL